MKHNVYWSRGVKIMSVAVAAILVYSCVMLVTVSGAAVWSLLVVALMAAVVLFAVWWAPLSVSLTDDALVINKMIGRTVIPYADIRVVTPYKVTTDLRLFGSGGFLGYTGLFSSGRLGRYHSYVGSYSQAFLVVTDRRKYVLSCEGHEQVIAFLTDKAGR